MVWRNAYFYDSGNFRGGWKKNQKNKKNTKKPTPSTYTDWWCDNVSLAWVLARHALFFVHFILFLQKRQIPVLKDKDQICT